MAEDAQAYRPDIDGLRAIAVLPVTLFHAGIPGFSGGFTGVDVFFVISGYLITGLLLKDLDCGGFSLLDFYARRVRRILPALLVVVGFTLVAGFFLLTPQQYAATGLAARAVMTISANMHFARIRSDYWNQSELAEEPLLHTWSLAVEEQFYLVLPALLWVGHVLALRAGSTTPRGHARLQFGLLGVLALASVVWAERLLGPRSSDAFFHLAPRAWELLAGSLLALAERARPAPAASAARDAAGAVGLVLLAASFVFLRERMAFPGVAAFPPCLGAVLVIYGGACQEGLVRRILSWYPMLFVGLISYSLYLWHWPVLVFFRSAGWHGRMLMAIPMPLQLAFMLIVAWLSWRWVEKPFRRPRPATPSSGWRTLLAGCCAATFVWFAGMQSVVIAQGMGPISQALPPVVAALGNDLLAAPGLRCEGAQDRSRVLTDGGGCMVGVGDGPPAFALLGDSHARMYTEAVHSLGQQLGVSVLVMARSSCVPALGLVPPTRKECEELTRASVDYLLRVPVRKIVLAGYWVDLAASQEGVSSLSDALDTTVARLVSGGKLVYLMKDVPELAADGDAGQAALRSIRERGATVFGPSRAQHEETQRHVTTMLERVASRWGAILLDPGALLCDAHVCRIAADSQAIYRDRHHLTDAAARELRDLFIPVVSERVSR